MEAVGVLDGRGMDECSWARCAWLWQRADTPVAQLLGAAGRLLVVAPHPDDEVLACAGLMRLAADAGVDVHVVAVTDGEACYPDDPWWTPARLRTQRRQELRDALHALGLARTGITHLGIDDGGVSAAEEILCDMLREVVRHDDLVLAPWRHDGHPDHEASFRAARQAANLATARILEYPVWGWHWLHPGAAQRAWAHPRLLDVRLHAAAKQAAIACFRTQTGTVEGLRSAPILPAHVLARFGRSREVFLA